MKGKKLKEGSFNNAFNSARNAKQKEFTWNGKRYNSELATPDSEIKAIKTTEPVAQKSVFGSMPGPSTVGVSDNVGRGIPKKNMVDISRPDTYIADQILKNRGTLKKITKKEFNKKPSLWDIASNPMTALEYKMNGRDIPANFQKGERNILDNAVDIINPATYLNAAGRTAKNLSHPINTIKTLGKATLNQFTQLDTGQDAYDRETGKALGMIGDAALVGQGLKSVRNLSTLSRDMKFNNTLQTKSGELFNNSEEFLDWHKATQNGRPLLKKEVTWMNKEIAQRGILEGQRSNPLNPLPKLTRRMMVPEDYNLKKVAKEAIPNLVKSIVKGNVYDQYTMGPGRLNSFNQWLGLPTEGSMYRVNPNSFKNGSKLLYTTSDASMRGQFDPRLAKLIPKGGEDLNALSKNTMQELDLARKYSNGESILDDVVWRGYNNEKEFFDWTGVQPTKSKSVFGDIDKYTGSGGGVSWKHSPAEGGRSNWTMRDTWDIQPFSRKENLPKSIRDIDVAKMIGAKNFDVNWNYQTTPKFNKIEDLNAVAGESTKGFNSGYIKREGGAITNTGYLPDSPDRFNDYNIIPSNQITMKKVKRKIKGIDNLGNEQMMYPGRDYTFPGSSVLEIPQAAFGGEDPELDIFGNPIQQTPNAAWVDPKYGFQPVKFNPQPNDTDLPEDQPFQMKRLPNANPELITSDSLKQQGAQIDPSNKIWGAPVKKKTLFGEIGKFIKDNPADVMNIGLGFLGNTLTDRQDTKDERKQATIHGSSDSQYTASTGNRGDWTENEGYFQPDKYVNTQHSANPYRSNGIPRAEEGMEIGSMPNLSAGLMPGMTEMDMAGYSAPQSFAPMPQLNIPQFNNESEKSMPTMRVNNNVSPNKASKFAFDYYKNKGIAPHIAAGIVGNLYRESGLKTNATEKGNTGNGRGIAQWDVRDRWPALLNWAKQSNRDPHDLTTQLDYIIEEPGEGQRVMQKLQHTRTPEEATYVFGQTYERPNKKYAAYGIRTGVALKLFNNQKFQEGGEYEMDEQELQQFLKSGGQVEYL